MKPPIGVHLRASACPFRAIYLEEKIKGLFSVKRKEFFATWIEPLVRGKPLKNYVEQNCYCSVRLNINRCSMPYGSLPRKGFLTLVITVLLLSPVFPYPYQSAQRLEPSGHPISTFYFAGEDETETWIEIVPDVRQSKLKPMRLNLSVKTRGNSVLTPPDSVTLTPILGFLYDPNMRRHPVARLLLDGQQQLDLQPTIANLIGQTHVGASVL